jgi:hypothetical protein
MTRHLSDRVSNLNRVQYVYYWRANGHHGCADRVS